MRWTFLPAQLLLSAVALAASPDQILSSNARAILYLQVEDAAGGVLDRGTGFIISHDGYVVTAAHLRADPTQRMWAVVGQREGTRFPLAFRDADEASDVALWQLPQSTACRYAVTLSTKQVRVLDRVLILGFPGNDGLTPSSVNVNNLTSQRGFYKADGYLRPGNSGGPVLNEAGQVVAIVQGGTLPGTENNDLVPIASAISLINKRGARAGIDAPVPFDTACYAVCRNPTHGVERWTNSTPWGPESSGWLSGGHNRHDECSRLIAATLAATPNATIDLLPGEGVPETTGMWEQSKKDVFGKVEYIYFCKGVLRTGPVYFEKQSPDCGLWN
jgi:hypothetical protein